MGALLRAAPPGTISLAQGVVHWAPPEQALQAARDAIGVPRTNLYGPDAGDPELRAALKSALAHEHGLTGIDVMVTAGANQAYLNAVLLTLQPGDSAALFAPYYFNHLMALQMCGHAGDVLIGPSVPKVSLASPEPVRRIGSSVPKGSLDGPGQARIELLPDLDWLEAELRTRNGPVNEPSGQAGALRLVTLCTPCNPTGTNLPQSLVARASALCASHGAFLFLDHAYAHFVHNGEPLATAQGAHVLSAFSFSKAYGMAGWRVGVLAHSPHLSAQLLKVRASRRCAATSWALCGI